MESWNQLLYDALRSDVSRPISVIFHIIWVFLGNFMLLNLFLAVLLDSFTEDDDETADNDK
jgi:Ion transport protein